MNDPIVVTAMGCWAPDARSPDELWAAALRGVSAATFVALEGATTDRSIAACRAPDPDLTVVPLRSTDRLDRAAKLALAAGWQAWTHAGLNSDAVDRDRVGLFVGSSRGPVGRIVDSTREPFGRRRPPGSGADTTPGSIAGSLSIALGIGGPAMLISTTCASAVTAIEIGALHLLAGDLDVAVVGGTEAPIVALPVDQMRAAGVLGWHADPTLTCRPFDTDRNGLVMGEGAGFLVLERASDARARGRKPYAVLAGWATAIDAGGRTGISENADGLLSALSRTLARSALLTSDFGYVNAHGTGTRLNDVAEARALNRFFGRAGVPPVSSTKPVTGHCLGATPALEAIIAILAMRHGCLPPTANHVTLDPLCELDVVAGTPRSASIDAVLSPSLGFWGNVGALAFTRP